MTSGGRTEIVLELSPTTSYASSVYRTSAAKMDGPRHDRLLHDILSKLHPDEEGPETFSGAMPRLLLGLRYEHLEAPHEVRDLDTDVIDKFDKVVEMVRFHVAVE